MSDVQFNENDGIPSAQSYYPAQSSGGSWLVNMAMKIGAKDERQANMIFLGIGVVFLISSFVIVYLQIREPSVDGSSSAGFDEFTNDPNFNGGQGGGQFGF